MPRVDVQPRPTLSAAAPAPLVSVIIPAYNAAEYIAEALESVLGQTYGEFEILVINDGSPDTAELERVLTRYRQRIRYLEQANRGPSGARNRGIREARGELIAFLDADDSWSPEYLEEQVSFLRRHPDTAAVYTDAMLFGNAALAGRTFMSAFPSRGDVTVESLLRRRCTVITSGVVARRAALLDVGLFDEELRSAEDYHLWLRLSSNGHPMRYQRKVLVNYRLRDDSLTSDTHGLIEAVLTSLRKLPRRKLTERDLTALRFCEDQAHAERALESAKHALAAGEFHAARRAMRRAARIWRDDWRRRRRLLAIRIIMRVAPRLLRTVFLWRERREGQARAA